MRAATTSPPPRYTVSILKNGTVLGTSAGTGNFTSTTLTLRTSTVTVPLTTFAAGDTLVLRVNNTSAGGTNRNVLVAQKTRRRRQRGILRHHHRHQRGQRDVVQRRLPRHHHHSGLRTG